MWADVDTKIDFLNYSEVADLAADVVSNPDMRPVSVGVFGTWGTGKSTLLNLIEEKLRTSPGEQEFIVVRFDAWLYQGFDDSRSALMDVIASALLEAAEAQEGLKEKAKKLIKRVNGMRLLGLLAEGGAASLGLPTFGLLSRGLDAVADVASGNAKEGDLKALNDAREDAQKRAKAILNPESHRTAPQEIAAFRTELGNLLGEMNKTLVGFIDNLDRCLPKQTIHTLEALRLFLFMNRTAFVIAADEQMVRHSVSQFFKEPDGRHVIDYLDKLIQVPIRVPRIGVQEVRGYLFLLFATADRDVSKERLEALRTGLEANLRASWKDEPLSTEEALALLGDSVPSAVTRGFAIADRIAPLLAKSTLVEGNPRIVKRMLNVVRMRSRLATARGMPVDEALIAKLAIFERCTDPTAVTYLYSAINEAPEGKPAILALLEDLREQPDEFKAKCPEPWAPRVDFIREWISLDPLLTGQDLRAAVYLSRETVPLRALRGTLSAAAAEGLRVLLRITSTSSPSGTAAAAAIPGPEMPEVMAALITELRKHGAWKTKPGGFDGALILAEQSPEAGSQLAAFIRTVAPEKLPPWLNILVKGAPWFKAAEKR